MLKAPESTLSTAAPAVCRSCSAQLEEAALFCPHCGKIQPPAGANFFSVFGLVPRLNLDLGMLEHQFHKLSRKLHPDRFARAGENEKEWSLAQSSLLNDAYRTLKEPLTRTYYLLKLHGAEIGEEFAGKDKKDPSRVPADLLEEVFELNMALEEVRSGDESARPQLEEAEANFTQMMSEIGQQLETLFAKYDAAPSRETLGEIRGVLNRRKYIQNLVNEVHTQLAPTN